MENGVGVTYSNQEASCVHITPGAVFLVFLAEFTHGDLDCIIIFFYHTTTSTAFFTVLFHGYSLTV